MPRPPNAQTQRYLRALKAQNNQLIRVNFLLVTNTLQQAVRQEVINTQGFIKEEAKDAAPVRKVFMGSKALTERRTRALSKGEAEAELDVRRRLAAQAAAYHRAQGKALPESLKKPITVSQIQQIRTIRQPTRGPRSAVPTNPLLRGRGINLSQPQFNRELTQPEGSRAWVLKNTGDLNARGRNELARGFVRGGGLDMFREINPETGTTRTRVQLGGRLKREIRSSNPPPKAGPIYKASVESPTYYARFVEFGTRHAAAQPYLRPAVAKARTTFRTNMLRALREAGKKRRRRGSL